MQQARALDELASFYERNGYVRRQNSERLNEETGNVYKKGDEVRLLARDKAELNRIRELLVKAGFKAGKPFVKKTQYCQPLYGREAVARFLELVGKRRRLKPGGGPD